MSPSAHDHSHGHPHASPESVSTALIVGIALNIGFVVIEVAFGLFADSLALLADAGHNFSDVIGLVLAWVAMMLARRIPSERFTFGLRRSTILAALANAMLLLMAVGGIVWEAIRRFIHPTATSEPIMIIVALAGVVINGTTALMLMRGRKTDFNVRGAFLHMVADTAVSVGVALAGAGMMLSGWLWLDPAISLVIAFVIFAGTWGLLKGSLLLSLDAVPNAIRLNDVKAFFLGLPQVREIHDLHVWGLSTTEIALTVHLVMPQGHPGDNFLDQLARELSQRFQINHSTFQIELGDQGVVCQLSPADVV